MSSVYPRTVVARVVEAVPDATLAERIIAAREANPSASRASVAGTVLQGSDDVPTYCRVWDDVEAERLAFVAVCVADHNTLAKFKAALSLEAEHLSVTKWVDGLKAEAGVSTWADLKALATEPVEAE